MGKEAIHVLPSWLQEVEIGEEEGELIGIVLSDLWLKRKTLGLEPLSDGAGLCFKIPSLKRTRWGQMGSAQDPLSRKKKPGLWNPACIRHACLACCDAIGAAELGGSSVSIAHLDPVKHCEQTEVLLSFSGSAKRSAESVSVLASTSGSRHTDDTACHAELVRTLLQAYRHAAKLCARETHLLAT